MFQYPITQNFNPYGLGTQGLYNGIQLPQTAMSKVNNPYPSVFQGQTVVQPKVNTNNGLFGSLTATEALPFVNSGIGAGLGLYQLYNTNRYLDNVGDALNRQQGLYEDEIARRNQTRESYGSAFSDAKGY